jgi:hypothetical protein
MSDSQYEEHLTPATGLRVIDPATNEPLPAKGKVVRGNDVYWCRRLNDREVTVGRKSASSSTQSQE